MCSATRVLLTQLWLSKSLFIPSSSKITICAHYDSQQGDVYMAFEYLEYDLWALANSSQVKLTATHIKTYMKQMLDAIAYMHTNKVSPVSITNPGRWC